MFCIIMDMNRNKTLVARMQELMSSLPWPRTCYGLFEALPWPNFSISICNLRYFDIIGCI